MIYVVMGCFAALMGALVARSHSLFLVLVITELTLGLVVPEDRRDLFRGLGYGFLAYDCVAMGLYHLLLRQRGISGRRLMLFRVFMVLIPVVVVMLRIALTKYR